MQHNCSFILHKINQGLTHSYSPRARKKGLCPFKATWLPPVHLWGGLSRAKSSATQLFPPLWGRFQLTPGTFNHAHDRFIRLNHISNSSRLFFSPSISSHESEVMGKKLQHPPLRTSERYVQHDPSFTDLSPTKPLERLQAIARKPLLFCFSPTT